MLMHAQDDLGMTVVTGVVAHFASEYDIKDITPEVSEVSLTPLSGTVTAELE